MGRCHQTEWTLQVNLWQSRCSIYFVNREIIYLHEIQNFPPTQFFPLNALRIKGTSKRASMQHEDERAEKQKYEKRCMSVKNNVEIKEK